jgi:hypothetical protein
MRSVAKKIRKSARTRVLGSLDRCKPRSSCTPATPFAESGKRTLGPEPCDEYDQNNDSRENEAAHDHIIPTSVLFGQRSRHGRACRDHVSTKGAIYGNEILAATLLTHSVTTRVPPYHVNYARHNDTDEKDKCDQH